MDIDIDKMVLPLLDSVPFGVLFVNINYSKDL